MRRTSESSTQNNSFQKRGEHQKAPLTMVQDCTHRTLPYENSKDNTQEDDDLQLRVLVTPHTAPLCALQALML